MIKLRSASPSAAVDVFPGVGEGVEQEPGGGADDADGVVAPQVALRRGRLHHPGAGVFGADVQPAHSRHVIIDQQQLAMIAREGLPSVSSFPWAQRMEFRQPHAAATHLLEDRGLLFPKPADAERAEGVVNHVDPHPGERLLAEQFGEGAAGVVVGEDVDLQANALPGVLDRFIGGMQRLAVLEELDARAVGEVNRRGDSPAVIVTAGRDIQTGRGSRLALPRQRGRWRTGR